MIDKIQSVGQKMPDTSRVSAKKAASSFAETFEKAFQDVNKNVLEADNKMAQLTTGQNKDIHGTMISMEKAQVSMKLLMAVRNKMVSAYEEIMRMQV